MARKKSKKSKPKQATSPIFSKLEHNTAKDVKKEVLEIQVNLLNAMQDMKEYNKNRKKENMYKLKLRNNLKNTNKEIRSIMKHVPDIEEINKIKEHDEKKLEVKTPKIKEKEKEKRQQSAIESKLDEIQKKLEGLS